MTKKKIRVAVLFGGKSAEHEVSLESAKSIITAINKNKYEVVLISINKTGQWLLGNGRTLIIDKSKRVALIPQSERQLSTQDKNLSVDVVFPVLHGPFGEDGTVQGLLKLANVPFVGAGVLGSAVGMDKDVMKRLLRDADIPIAKFQAFTKEKKINFSKIKKELGLPLFVKPANMGSSIGVTKVKSEREFKKAIKEALQFDSKVLIEEAINGREIEVAVLGNEKPIVSIVGEIKPKDTFYTYKAKYTKGFLEVEIPAKIPQSLKRSAQQLALKAYRTLCVEGMARVDMFLKKDGSFFVNELNTIPGFTSESVYPKLWQASGVSYSELIDRLIALAIKRFEREKKLKTSHV